LIISSARGQENGVGARDGSGKEHRMARHRSDVDSPASDFDFHEMSQTRTRRIPHWPFAAAGVVMLLVAALLVWRWNGTSGARSPAAAATTCTEGPVTIRVAAAPSIAGPLKATANRYLAGHPVASGHCVQVAVTALDPQTVFTALTQGWDPAKLGPPPQAWLPDSSLWTDRLAAANSTLVGDPAQSVASSPVVLAVTPQLDQAVASGQSMAWHDIPDLVTAPDGWSRFGQPAAGPFILALPDPTTDTASLLALESILDPATPQGQPPLTTKLLNSSAVRGTAEALANSQPDPAPPNSVAALITLANSYTGNAAPFSAVPVLEVDLYRRNDNADGQEWSQQTLNEIRLTGQTPFADFPFLPLAGNSVTSTQVSAAQNFRAFLLSATAQGQLSGAGLRPANGMAATTTPADAPGMDWGAAAQAPSLTDATSYQVLIQAWDRAEAKAR
jgi:hypothetical protein